MQIKEMPIRGESLETTRRGWLVVERKEVTEHARTRLGDPNEKLFIFDIQNAIAGPFFPPSSFEKRREEERRKRERESKCPDFRYIFHRASLPSTLCLWGPVLSPFADHLRTPLPQLSQEMVPFFLAQE